MSQAVATASSAVAHLKNVPVPVLSSSSVPAATPVPQGFEDKDDVKEYGNKDWRDQQKDYDDVMTQQEANRMKDVPMRAMPKKLIADLYTYQRDGVRWLTHKETTFDEIPPFYKEVTPFNGKGPSRYYCTLRNRSFLERPQPIRGSILADGKYDTYLPYEGWSER